MYRSSRHPCKRDLTVSEYQYYEFQAIDRPLGEADRQALEALSSRARVTATSFTNHYNYGDFRGDPGSSWSAGSTCISISPIGGLDG